MKPPAAHAVHQAAPVDRTVVAGAVVWLLLVVGWLTWTPLLLAPEPNRPVLFPPTNPVDLLGNALLLAPLGAVIAIGASARPLARAVVVAVVVSCAVEAGQVFLEGRIVSLTDVVLNVAGALAGAWIANRLRRTIGHRRAMIATIGAVFTILLLFTLTMGPVLERGMRLVAWDPSFHLFAGVEGDGDNRYQGEVREARICAGAGAARICAAPGASADVRRHLAETAERSQQLDIHARVRSAVDVQWGPARIVTFSADSHRRNVTLGQEGDVLVLRLRTPMAGPNGREFEIWIPRAIHRGEDLAIDVSYRDGSVRTSLRSATQHRVVHHAFDALASGLLLRGSGSVTPRQMFSTRMLGGLILLLPLALLARCTTMGWRPRGAPRAPTAGYRTIVERTG